MFCSRRTLELVRAMFWRRTTGMGGEPNGEVAQARGDRVFDLFSAAEAA
jgi:hypothetical protein